MTYDVYREKFLSKAIKLPDGCWGWSGTILYHPHNGHERPIFCMEGRNVIAATAAWELFKGPIPAGKMICHSRECNQECCVNPDHLYVGDQASNMADAKATGRLKRDRPPHNFLKSGGLIERVRDLLRSGAKIREVCAWLRISTTVCRECAPDLVKHKLSANKLTPAKVRKIRSLRATGEKLRLIARAFSISETCVSHICLRKTWKHV
jgi:hypothetical protein